MFSLSFFLFHTVCCFNVVVGLIKAFNFVYFETGCSGLINSISAQFCNSE